MSSTRADRHRILVFVKGLGLGGAERLIADSAAAWDRSQFDYTVAYVLPWKDQLTGQLEEAGIDVRCIGSRRGLDPTTLKRLRDLADEVRADLIHAHLPSAGIIARFAGRPVVYTEHNIAASYRQPTRSANRLTYGRNQAVIAVSEAVADSLSGYPGPDPIVVENGISVETPPGIETVREELGIDDGTTLAVHVGNIRPHKGHSNLIAATTLLGGQRDGFQVVSIGAEKNEGDLERVRTEAQEAGVAHLIRFLGRRDDARRFLAAADVVVNPSDFEGLPVTLLEALSFGRPVVATDVGGVKRVIIDEETGLLVPPKDPGALAAAMGRAMDDPNAVDWARRGKELIRDQFSIEKMVRSQEEIYLEVLSG